MRNRTRTVPRLLGRVALLALAAGGGWLAARRQAALGAPVAAADWQTAAVEQRDIGATVLATGVVRPEVGALVAVGSRISGVLRRLHVTVGDRVEAGELLAELDRAELETEMRRAEAVLATAAAELEFAEREFDRARTLAGRNAASAAALDAARRALDAARARRAEAAAALDAAEVRLGYTRIRAPIRGVVASVSTQEGETVAASFAAPTFVTIVDLSRLEVWAYVDETDIGRIEPGQRAQFTVDAWPDETFTGRVTAIRPSAELRDNVVNYVTLIEIESTNGRQLRPEMTATISIILDGRAGAVSVPNGALRRDAGGSYVLVPSRDGPARRDVQVGFRGAEFTEVLAGVRAGERVIVGAAPQCGHAAEGRDAA